MKRAVFAVAAFSVLVTPVSAQKFPLTADTKLGATLMQQLDRDLAVQYPHITADHVLRQPERTALCRADEGVMSEISQQLLASFTQELQEKNWHKVDSLFVPGAKIDAPASEGPSARSLGDGISLLDWQYPAAVPAKRIAPAALAEVFKTWKLFSHVELDVFEYYVDQRWRVRQYGPYQQVQLKAQWRVFGESTQGGRQQQTMDVLIDVRKHEGEWRIAGLQLLKSQKVISKRAPSFTEMSQQYGLADVPVYLRREAMRRGGYSVAVTDLDNDKAPDVFVGTGGEAVTLRGKAEKELGFRFERSHATNNPQGSFVKSAVFADFDNDGDQDAVLVRFVASDALNDELVFFRNDGKGAFTFEPLLRAAALEKKWAMPAAVADFNGDNFLDIYVGYPGKKDFTTFTSPGPFDPSRPTPHGLFFGLAGQGFTNVAAEKIDHLSAGVGYLYPHSALAFDYDHNRTTDLIVIDDRNNLSPLYRNNGDSFDQVADKIGVGNSGYGMSVAVGDFNHDGLIDIAMTNVNLVAEERFLASCDRNWNIQPTARDKGLRLFKNLGDGKFTEVTEQAGLGWPGSAAGGLTFLDYNNDGLDDLYVVNGLWSGNDPRTTLDAHWAMANLHNNVLTNSLKYETNETQSAVMNILIHHRPAGKHLSLGGFQRNKLYRNNGDGSFTEVGYLENVDEINDGYAVVTLDVDRDGKQELLLRNADPGSELNRFAPVQLYKNNFTGANNALSLSLQGRESLRDAIGAEVVAEIGKQKTVRQLLANNGPQQSERRLHFGMGKHKTAQVTIRWPSGLTEKKTLKPGHYDLQEPTRMVQALEP